MGVLLRRNHRRVAANMVEVSAGLPACVVFLPARRSVYLTCRALALLEISRGGLGWFRGGENWSSVWIGPRRGNCDMQPQTGGQKVERSEMSYCPTWSTKAHDTGEKGACSTWCAVSQAKWTTSKSYAQPFPGIALHLQLVLQLYLGPRLRSTVANSQAGGTLEARTWTSPAC